MSVNEGPIAGQMRKSLTERFAPVHLEIVDDSESHRGHAGHSGGGESHFNVLIVSAEFEGLSRVARHRAVHEALGKELTGRIHALSLTLRTPD